jgi:uncharacterized protein (TIGR03382 family)
VIVMRTLATTLLAGAALFAASTAGAATVQIQNITNGAALTGVSVSFDSGATFGGALAGQLEIRKLGGTATNIPNGDYFTFCVEPTEFLADTILDLMGVEAGDTAQGGMGPVRADQVRELLARHHPVLDVAVGNVVGAAIQIALWEIVREASGAPLSVLSGSFRVAGPAPVLALADTYLGSLTGGPTLWNLRALTRRGAQDLLIQTPAPAALALFGLGLAALAARRRAA